MKTLGFVFRYARRYVRQLVAAVLTLMGLVGVQLLAPQIIRQLVALVNAQIWDSASQNVITRWPSGSCWSTWCAAVPFHQQLFGARGGLGRGGRYPPPDL